MALKFGMSDWQRYRPRDDDNAPIVLCFGDSWFWYPIPGISNLSTRLLDFGRHQSIDIVAIGEVGLEIANPGKRILGELTTFLQWESKTVDIIIISGGGNDFAGADDLDPLLQVGTADNATSWFDEIKTDDLFKNVKTGFQRIIYLRDTFCPKVPIVTHCFDYSQANGEGLLWFSPWIKPSLDKIGMPPALHTAAVKYIIDRLADVQTSLSGPNYQFIDTRGLLGPDDWSNELHPTGEGFDKIARPFYPVFAEKFPDWVRKPKWL